MIKDTSGEAKFIMGQCILDLQKYTGEDKKTNDLIAKTILEHTALAALLGCEHALRDVVRIDREAIDALKSIGMGYSINMDTINMCEQVLKRLDLAREENHERTTVEPSTEPGPHTSDGADAANTIISPADPGIRSLGHQPPWH